MKKEIIIAILLGLTVGLFITYTLYRSRNVVDDDQTKKIEELLEPTPEAETLSNLVIHSPEDESIIGEDTLTVAGDTDPENFVAILVNENEYLTTADETGAFSVSVDLEAGSNIISVHSIDEDGKTTVDERTVVFTTQSLTQTEEEESSSEETTEDSQQEPTDQ